MMEGLLPVKSKRLTLCLGKGERMISFRSKAALVGLLVASVGGMGCGSSGSGGEVTKFAGIWHPSSGTVTLICPTGTTTVTVTDNLTWTKGASSDLVQTSAGTSCVLNADITGGTATALPSQSCTETGTLTLVINLSAYTFSLGADGQTATESTSGSAVESEAGASQTCTYSESAIYSKISG
jgi:hypothetical protein